MRQKDAKLAWQTSVAAVRTIGIGMAVELVCAMVAVAVLSTSVLTALF